MIFATATNIFYERTGASYITMEQSIKACAAAGYKFLDFGFVELFFQSERFRGPSWHSEIEEYAVLAKELGVQFVQGHATLFDFCRLGCDHEEGLEMFKRSIYGAQTLGIPWLVAHPSTGVKDGALRAGTHEENVFFFRAMAQIAKEVGVGIALENMWRTTPEGVRRYATDPLELLKLIEDIGCENVGACWDTIHANLEGIDQVKAIRLLGHHLKATHLSDQTGPDNFHILPYLGTTNWAKVLEVLAEINYQGPLAFEMQHYLRNLPLELVPTALELSVKVGQQMVEVFTTYSN